MNTTNTLINIAAKLQEQGFTKEANEIIAQVLELNNITNVNVITPDHPLYPAIQRVLRPEQAIQEKLSNFSERLSL